MTHFTNQTIVVVGGAGFVGINLVKLLLDEQPKHIIIIDNLLSAERLNIPNAPSVKFVENSINATEALAAIPQDTDYIFHLSTYHGNQSSIADPLADHEHNTLTTLNLCERMKDLSQLKRVVYASAGCTVAEKTFDDAEATSEDAPISLYLDSPYQISKIIGELYLNYYFMRYNVPAVKARFQNVYGPGEILGAGAWRGTNATVWRNVTPTFIYRSLKHLSLPVQKGGVATRDFIYVTDIARGLMACAEQGEAGGVYNLASGVETSILELANLVNELTGNPTPIEFEPAREWDRSGKRFGSTEKATAQLHFSAETDLRTGLIQTIQWTRDHLNYIEHTMLKHVDRMPELQHIIQPATQAN
jgi:nucleoside-diphosphate-sugar epimerase